MANQSDLDAINAAIYSSTLSVQYADKKITYRSMDELLRAKQEIEKDLGLTLGSRSSVSSYSRD